MFLKVLFPQIGEASIVPYLFSLGIQEHEPITAITRSSDLSPSPFLLLLAQFAAAACVFIAAFFFRRFRDHMRDGTVMSILVHCDKRQIGGRDVARCRGNGVLNPALHPDLH